MGAEVFTTLLSQESPYIALMANETTGIAATKELILYARFIIPSTSPQCCVRSIFSKFQSSLTAKLQDVLTSLECASIILPVVEIANIGGLYMYMEDRVELLAG